MAGADKCTRCKSHRCATGAALRARGTDAGASYLPARQRPRAQRQPQSSGSHIRRRLRLQPRQQQPSTGAGGALAYRLRHRKLFTHQTEAGVSALQAGLSSSIFSKLKGGRHFFARLHVQMCTPASWACSQPAPACAYTARIRCLGSGRFASTELLFAGVHKKPLHKGVWLQHREPCQQKSPSMTTKQGA